MKLIYLYFEWSGRLSGWPLSFDSEYICRLRGNVLGVERNEKYIPGFFSLDPECGTSNLTATVIVGENGTGKTSIASVLYHIYANDNFVRRYILVYEAEGCVSVCRSGFDELCIEYAQGVNGIRENFRIECIRPLMIKTIYHSSVYTSQRSVWDYGDDFVDISTTGLLESLPEKVGNVINPMSYHISQTGSLNACDQIWVLEFLYDLFEGSNDEDVLFCELGMAIPKQCLIFCNDRSMGPVMEDISKWNIPTKSVDAVADVFERGCAKDAFLRFFLCYACNYLRAVNANAIPVADEFTFESRLRRFLVALAKYIVEHGDSVGNIGLHARILLFFKRSVAVLKRHEGRAVRGTATQVEAAKDFFEFLFKRTGESSGILQDPPGVVVKLTDRVSVFDFLKAIKAYSRSRLITDYIVVKYAPSISSGEMSFLTLWGRLHKHMNDNDQVLLFMDESETTLHPRWQRMLVYAMIWYFERFRPSVKAHIIFASHSPMLLSDFPHGNVVFLPNKRSTLECDSIRVCDNIRHRLTFAASISDLYLNAYGLGDGPYGVFAQKKLESLFDKKNKGGYCALEGRDALIADEIGDEMIRNYLKSNR